ncbi:MAG: glutamate racemase [Bacteroidales bacterium]|nr:glutamate racemase [Bacteroidales bacterium]
MNSLNNKPVGVFDSGVGGLTVAHAIKQIMPDESLVYFGDTAHLPYGDKSEGAIINYSRKITDFLIGHGAKLILIACNSASASAYSVLKNEYGEQVLLLDVISPVIDYVATKKYSRVGVIGTKRTITSGTYEMGFKEKSRGTELVSLATPLLVPMIEEGFIFDDISNAIIRTYLSDKKLEGIQALVLGCTHYPLIRNQISKFYNFDIEVVDSARIVALELKEMLGKNKLLNKGEIKTEDKFFVSDYTTYFEKIARMFFEGGDINLEVADIWN